MTFLLTMLLTFIRVSNLYIPYEDYLLLKTYLKSQSSDISDRKWKNITIKDSEYLVKSVHYEGKIIYAIISSEDILKPLNKLNIGNNGKLSLKVTLLVNVHSRSSPWRKSTVVRFRLCSSGWIRYGLMDPETKYALLGTMGKAEVKDLLADWYSATCLFMQPDPMHKKIDKAWITTNMFPLANGDITGKRDLTACKKC